MTLSQSSLAAAVGVTSDNVQFTPTADILSRKIAIIGSYDPAITTITDDVPQRVLSPEDAGDRYGFGFMIHRLAEQVFAGSSGVECWVIPQSEDVAAVQADGSIDFAGSSGVEAGTLYLYIAGILVTVAVADADTADDLATNTVAAINADPLLPVTAAVDGVTTSQVNVTAKSAGPWGNDITIRFNIRYGESLPVGVTAAITDMASGATNPDISTALDGLGTDDGANEMFITDLVHGYGQETATLDAILTYVGQGNDFIALYDKLVSRPFRALTGDIATGSSGLSDLTTLGDGRKLDRANGVVAVPGSANHPSEIAAQVIGHMARINNDRAEQHYLGVELIDIDPGDKADRWTSDYDSRDIAVKAGVSPTRVQNGVVTLQNMVTFYHPDNVPISSNGYRSMRNISILQNIFDNVRVTFEQEKWQGISIVEDTANVANVTDRQKARDIDSVVDDLVALARAFEARAWIYTASFTIENISVSIRSGNIGFDSVFPIILSGEGVIIDTVVQFDTSIAVLL